MRIVLSKGTGQKRQPEPNYYLRLKCSKTEIVEGVGLHDRRITSSVLLRQTELELKRVVRSLWCQGYIWSLPLGQLEPRTVRQSRLFSQDKNMSTPFLTPSILHTHDLVISDPQLQS